MMNFEEEAFDNLGKVLSNMEIPWGRLETFELYFEEQANFTIPVLKMTFVEAQYIPTDKPNHRPWNRLPKDEIYDRACNLLADFEDAKNGEHTLTNWEDDLHKQLVEIVNSWELITGEDSD